MLPVLPVLPVLPLLFGCAQPPTYIVEGVVVEIRPHDVVIDHKDIAGFMPAMTMPFSVADPAVLESLSPGHRIVGRLRVEGMVATLEKVRITGKGPAPKIKDEGPAPVRPGALFPATALTLADGSTMTVGEGQDEPTALTFLYTRCPVPEYCPATVLRLQALQGQITDAQRLVAVTLDPAYDTAEVLGAFSSAVGADRSLWSFGMTSGKALPDLVMRAGMRVAEGEEGDIVHGLRLLVLDKDGRLVERYDDNNWPLDRVLQQLTTGGPPAPQNTSGTLTLLPE
jgi:protein SCO1/2